MKYKLVIFDWDGTLVDSTTKISNCLAHAAQQSELPILSESEYKSIIGLGLREAILALYPEIQDEQLEIYRQAYSDHYLLTDKTPQPFFEGAIEMLQTLTASEYLLAVATGKSRKGLNRAFSNPEISALFHTSRCADETKSKPHPLMLEEILDELKIHATEAVMIGDTSFDLEMAQAAGVDRIGVDYGAHEISTLEKYSPITILKSMTELQKWL